MGLWLIQEARRSWKTEGIEYSYDTLTAIARNAPPFVSLFDPDDSRFLAPGDMPARIRQYWPKPGSLSPKQRRRSPAPSLTVWRSSTVMCCASFAA